MVARSVIEPEDMLPAVAQGAIGIDGALRPRFDVMKRWGTFTHDFEADFSSSEEIEDAVTVLNDGAYAVPQAGTRDDMQALYAAEYSLLSGIRYYGIERLARHASRVTTQAKRPASRTAQAAARAA